MTGQVLRTPLLTTPSGRMVPTEILRMAPTAENVQELKQTEALWKSQASAELQRQPAGSTAMHAYFAADVAFLAAADVRSCSAMPTCFPLAAVGDGAVLGLHLSRWDNLKDVWYIGLQVTRPMDQPGWPNSDRIRGVGTELLGAALAEMNKQTCARVELDALDEEAKRFWTARGFHNTVEPLWMSCPESQALAAKLAHTDREDPNLGDEPFAADRSRLRRASFVPY